MSRAAATQSAGEPLSPDATPDRQARDAERYRLALGAIDHSVYDWNIDTGAVEHPTLRPETRRKWATAPLSGADWLQLHWALAAH